MKKRKEKKECLEFLDKTISGLKKLTIRYGTLPTSGGDVGKKEIWLKDEDNYEKEKTISLHETGHLWLSGSLKREYQNWNAEKNGNFKRFKTLTNILEDLRVENLVGKPYPQAATRFINCRKDEVREFKKKNPDFKAESPLHATFIGLEDRYETVPVDKKLDKFVEKIKKIGQKRDFKNGDWKNLVKTAFEVNKEIKKYEFSQIGGFQKALNKLMKEMEKAQNKFNENVSSQKNAQEEKLYHQRNKKNAEDFKTSTTNEDVKKQLTEKIKKCDEKAKEIDEKTKKLEKKVEEIREKEWKPLSQKSQKISGKIAAIRKHWEDEERKIPKSFEHRFEQYDGNKGAKLSAKDIEKILEKAKKAGKMMGLTDRKFEPPKIPNRNGIDNAKVKVTKFTLNDRFVGHAPIPQLELALEIGNEIASRLKRELNLQEITLRKKISGGLDLKALKRQILHFDEIVEPRIMKRDRTLLEKHSVLVLCDFSGSMGINEGHEFKKIQYAKQAFVILGQTLDKLNIPYSLRAFSARNMQDEIADIVVKEFDDKDIDFRTVNRVFHPAGGGWGENRDGESIRHAAKVLDEQRGKKLLIVISDGIPSHGGASGAYGGEAGRKDTIKAVEEVENAGMKVIGISISPESHTFVKQAYPKGFTYNNLDDFSREIVSLYVNTMMKKGG